MLAVERLEVLEQSWRLCSGAEATDEVVGSLDQNPNLDDYD